MAILHDQRREDRQAVSLELYCGSVPPVIAGEVVRLICRVWPEWTGDPSQMAQNLMNTMREDPSLEIIVAWKGEHVVGQAQLFQRVLRTEKGQVQALALSTLCSDPRKRGQGVGTLLATRVFEEVELSHYPVCLFQTSAPAFFERFGARRIGNAFFNRRNRRDSEANPWWQPAVMIYPDWEGWPEGPIDLNGDPF